MSTVHKFILSAVGLLLVSAAFTGWRFVGSTRGAKRDSLQELEVLPIGPVHLQGTVTYLDLGGKRFWIQDETGAIPVEVDPKLTNVRPGQVVRVDAKKTHSYNSAIGTPSVGLVDWKVQPTKTVGPLPLPVAATLATLPEKEKNGIRVQVSGVVQHAGPTGLQLGEDGREMWVVLPALQTDLARWVNGRVRISGVSEIVHDSNGNVLSKNIFVQDADDVEFLNEAPKEAPLYSIRTLYADASSRNGHAVRLRGKIGARLNANSFLLEDEWGAVYCESDEPLQLAVGAAVEVFGFPGDGLRIDLFHVTVRQSSPQKIARGSDRGSLPEVTSVAAVRTLSPDEARLGLPVRITGVITFIDSDWRQLFLQDSTGGIYAKYAGSSSPVHTGERVTLLGITSAGDYAPVVLAPKIIPLGFARLPKPRSVTAREAASGILDSQLVSVEGVMHSIKPGQNPRHVAFELHSPFGLVHVETPPGFGSVEMLRRLEDARVRMTGVCGTIFNSRRQLVGFQLYVSSIGSIDVLEPGDPDPFQAPPVLISQLLTFSPKRRFDHRVQVQGSVTMVGAGFFYLQDQSGGLKVHTDDTHGLRIGDMVAVVGYAEADGYSPMLTDANVRLVRHEVPIQSQSVTSQSLVGGQFDSRLVTIDGRLLSLVNALDSKILIVQSGGRAFDAQLYALDPTEPAPELHEGSTLRLTGICFSQVTPSAAYMLLAQQPVGFKLMIRSSQDIQVVKPASWWNLRHTAMVLGLLVTGTFSTIAWVIYLQRRVHRQSAILAEASRKALAIQTLAAAMQEVTVRKEFSAEVPIAGADEIAQLGMHFNAMLSELRARESAKQQAEAKLQQQALTDELTGLPNRRLLSDRLTQALAHAKRDQQKVAVLYLDLDGFKLVNDSLGHSIGDALLGQVAERLRSRIREADTLARLGGDEFVVVLTSLRHHRDAEVVAKALLQSLSTPFGLSPHEVTITASIGISLFPQHGSDAEQLVQQADNAMYYAKRTGKNRFINFTPELGSMAQEKLDLETQLRGAIDRNEISVEYQPEFDIESRCLVRFEALARWTHANLGKIPPDKFIPIAEETGLIIPLGAYILRRACAEAVAWQRVSSYPIQVAVNVSTIQFARETFVNEVAEVLRETGLPPKLLQIELTESVMLTGTELAAETLRRLGTLGVSIAIDDFGTGYSCFSYLPKLPFNALKIDRAFVKELSTTGMKAIVRSLVTLAHNLNMQVVVEGIETVEQLESIRALGGNQVQGFLLGRPTPDPVGILASRKNSQNQKKPARENPASSRAKAAAAQKSSR